MKNIRELVRQELGIVEPILCPILDVSEPIMIAMNNNGEWYLIYLLQNRKVKTIDNKRTTALEILVSSSDIQTIKSVALGEISIRKALLSNEIYRIGKIANRTFKKTKVEDEDCINDKIPVEGYRLNSLMPNRVNVLDLVDDLSRLE